MSNFTIGLSTAAIGMIVVFVGLAILIGCIMLMGLLTKRLKSDDKPAEAPAPAAEEPVQEEETEENDDALVAVITAAVMCVWDKKDTGFVVRRIRRCPVQNSWQSAARDEQMNNRM